MCYRILVADQRFPRWKEGAPTPKQNVNLLVGHFLFQRKIRRRKYWAFEEYIEKHSHIEFSPEGDTNLMFWPIFLKNYIKLKIGCGGKRPWRPLLELATGKVMEQNSLFPGIFKPFVMVYIAWRRMMNHRRIKYMIIRRDLWTTVFPHKNRFRNNWFSIKRTFGFF